MRYLLIVAAALLAGGGLAGCEPAGKVTFQQVMTSRPAKSADYNACAEFIKDRYLRKRDSKDYVVWAMEYASLCLMGGNYDAGRAELLECYKDIKLGTGGETAAAIGREAAKRFKGEPFERAMVCSYLGLLYYMEGDYDNARVFFTQANMQDATTGENMAAYRDDFGLAHFWLGRVYARLGQEDNSRIAFAKATQALVPMVATLPPGTDKASKKLQKQAAAERAKRDRLEALCFKQATNAKKPIPGVVDLSKPTKLDEMPAQLPGASGENGVVSTAGSQTEFLTPAFQKDVNLTVIIEVGLAPVKILVGEHQEQDAILPAKFPEKLCLVYLNGNKVGPAYPLVDLFFQAATRGMGDKDKAQAGKGIAKSLIKGLVSSDLAGMWDIRADERYWHLMPSEMHVFAARVKPGIYTLNLQCFDANGYLLPRYRLTRYCLPVRDGVENIFTIHIQPEVDNVYVAKK